MLKAGAAAGVNPAVEHIGARQLSAVMERSFYFSTKFLQGPSAAKLHGMAHTRSALHSS
jgi:hypothetical protein